MLLLRDASTLPRLMGGSVSFDRIADRYDTTRGGTERGGRMARAVAPLLQPGLVVEIGVGTGAVALPLRDLGHPVVGVDLSPAMLRHARGRLGPRVAVADGYRLPVPTRAVPNALVVWVLQLVPDVAGFLAEAGRIVAPGGRLVVVPAGSPVEGDEIDQVLRPMHEALRPPRSRAEHVVAAAPVAGLRVVERRKVGMDGLWHTSPDEQARQIESRAWASLWDVADDRWAEVVAPAIEALRALPDPERPRARRGVFETVVLTPDG